MDFQVWDFPGQIDILEDPTFDMDAIFGEIGALIWVIDAQDDYLEAVARLNTTIPVSFPRALTVPLPGCCSPGSDTMIGCTGLPAIVLHWPSGQDYAFAPHPNTATRSVRSNRRW